MSDYGSENNPIAIALREFFKPLLKVTQDLPAPLAYSLAAVLALLVSTVLGVALPTNLTILVGIVLLAGLAAFVYLARTTSDSKSSDSGDTVEPSKIETLASGKVGILVDLSHQQQKWRPSTIFDLPTGKSNLLSLVVPPGETVEWDVREIQDIAQFQVSDLVNWRSLIFGMPYHTLIDQQVLDAIVEWVNQGGCLILLGYECGERHHKTNLNLLSDRLFGLRFNSDIIAPENWQPPDAKPFGQQIVFRDFVPNSHPILKDITSLCMRNVCTLTVEPGSRVILSVGRNRVSREMDPNYVDGWTSSGKPTFEMLPQADWVPVVAEAAKGLCGKGRVIAIGTWDFFGTDAYFKNNDNYIFVKNLLQWSVQRS